MDGPTDDSVTLIASPDARALFDEAVRQQPMLGLAGITADGKLHDDAFPDAVCDLRRRGRPAGGRGRRGQALR